MDKIYQGRQALASPTPPKGAVFPNKMPG